MTKKEKQDLSSLSIIRAVLCKNFCTTFEKRPKECMLDLCPLSGTLEEFKHKQLKEILTVGKK